MVTRSRSSSFLQDQDQDCVDGPEHRRLGRISRSADGRFVLTRDSRSSSLSSTSDDGGFLSHPSFSNRTWSRRPLIAFRGDEDRSVRTEDSADSRRRPIVATVCGPQTPYRASSPTSRNPPECFVQDLSSVRGSFTAERTLRSVHEQYSQQLPSLRVIHEENQRTLMQRQQQQQQQQQQPSPRYHPNPRFRSRHMRYARSAPELTSDATERSPESRSSSSGFGSKNTSSHQNYIAGAEWGGTAVRGIVPPYKPPPPPPPPPSLFYANERWLDYTCPVLPSPSSHSSASKPLSVDDQYEFDPVFPVSPTPTDVMAARTPTTPSPCTRSRTPTQLKKAKYENVEARLQAMKEEFYAYKRRQAEMARMGYVESAC